MASIGTLYGAYSPFGEPDVQNDSSLLQGHPWKNKENPDKTKNLTKYLIFGPEPPQNRAGDVGKPQAAQNINPRARF